MSLLDELSPASYKGVNFLVTSARLAGGRKDVKHSYPNKNTQVIEDLGKMPRTYNLEIVITGADYIQARDRLINVLEEGGLGPLVHPFYGRIENIAARTYTLNEDMTALGEGRLSVVFGPSNDTGIPQASTNTLNNVAAKNKALQDAVKADIGEGFTVTESFTGNFSAAVELLNDTVDAFTENTSVLQASADEIDGYTRQISDFSENVLSLVTAPVALADSLGNLFSTVGNLYPTAAATAAVLTGFFDFGDGGAAVRPTTAGRVERANNANIINSAMQSMSLGYAYLNSVQIDFETTEEIEAVADNLEIQYKKTAENDGLSDDAKSVMIDLRLAAQDFFEAEKLTVRKTITVHTSLTSARELAYRYYGSSEDGERLVNLNDAQDVTFIEGRVKVLTA